MNNVGERMNRDAAKGDAVDVFKIADLLIARAIERHGDEIDIVGYYGSYA
jgi:hypothetical protein